MNTWKPITLDELNEVVQEQLERCTAQQRVDFSRFRVPFQRVGLHRLGSVEDVWIVAHLPMGLMYFEDVEEGFEVGVPGADGMLPDQGSQQLEISHVLFRNGYR